LLPASIRKETAPTAARGGAYRPAPLSQVQLIGWQADRILWARYLAPA
jgi:hypothetical protein